MTKVYVVTSLRSNYDTWESLEHITTDLREAQENAIQECQHYYGGISYISTWEDGYEQEKIMFHGDLYKKLENELDNHWTYEDWRIKVSDILYGEGTFVPEWYIESLAKRAKEEYLVEENI